MMPATRERPTDCGRIQDKQRLVVVQRQRRGHRPLLAPDHLGAKIVVQGEGTVQVARIERRLGEALVVACHMPRQERVGLGDRRDFLEPHRLDQAVL
ncbi:hypothetical protein sphantq_04520 (plasmid) [Sphingobium sp. AntQ-1]|uniref:hypothetical protein n=1 Tax=Sphingobium sp. AntQ-1 TaxID=2930091 RepID=UPI0027A6DF3F|nr:hypothetical protein sphantq_04520 [Sphingobium sp. AntQ-1]